MDYQEEAVKIFVNKLKRINEMIREKEKDFDGSHCVFCGDEIQPRERVSQCGKIYCKACAERLFRW